MVTQFAIEPHAFMAAPDDDGLVVWSTIQHPNWLQRVIAGMVGLPLSRVRVIAPDPGGGFGGKQHAKYEPAVVFAALRLGRPVRLVLSLEETFQAVRRAACETHVRIGFDAEGRILFEDIAADYLIGAYTDIADRVVGKGSYPGAGPYNVPAVRILARSILSHTVPSTAFRGFGNPQVNWAVESTLDEGAPARSASTALELRLRNLARARRPVHPVRHAVRRRLGAGRPARRGARRLGRAAPRGPRPRDRRRHQVRPDDRALSYAIVRLLVGRLGRRLRRHVGHGPGRADRARPGRGARARRAARLGHGRHGRHGDRPLRPADVGLAVDGPDGQRGPLGLPVDPGAAGGDGGAAPRRRRGGRRGRRTASSGCRTARSSPLEVLERRPGAARRRADRRRRGAQGRGARITRSAARAAFFEFNCTVIEAHVDEETGDITIDRHVTVSDVGKAINPLQVRMQDEGAAIMGLGHTLMEQYLFDGEGRIRNLGAIDYRIPTAMDLPTVLESAFDRERRTGPGRTARRG